MSDAADGLLAALQSAGSGESTPETPSGESSLEQAFATYKEKGDLQSFKDLIDEALDEALGDD